MKVLITGGCGFIGAALAEQLIDSGYTVTLFDLDNSNITHRPKLTGAKFIRGNIACAAHVNNAVRMSSPDAIVHLAARLSAPSEEDPWSTYEVNVQGTYHALEAARVNSIKRFVFASSIGTYGLCLPDKIDDETIQRPLSVYGATKVFGEQLGTCYRRKFGLDFRSIRPCQLVGPGVKTFGVAQCIPMAIEAAVQGRPFSMWLEEDCKVPVLSYMDGVSALRALLEAPSEAISTINYNLAGISPAVTVRQIVSEIEAVIPNAAISFMPEPDKVEIVRSLPSNIDDSRLRRETGYAPKYDLKGMIRSFLS
jgi:threonine 3-dehydrogenase